MPQAIPLIRTGSLIPIVDWIEENGGSAERHLGGAGLGRLDLEQRERPISMVAALTFLQRVARSEGAADLGLRVVDTDSFSNLGRLGQLAVGAKTPRDLVMLVSLAFPRFCSHQRLTINDNPLSPTIRFRFPDRFPPAAVHLAHQYNLKMVDTICAATGEPGPYFTRITLPPDDNGGVTALASWFDCETRPGSPGDLDLLMRPGIMDRPLQRHPKPIAEKGIWQPLRQELDFRSSAVMLIGDLLVDDTPTAGRLAELSGMSLRTMQRRLEAIGTSFSTLLDEVRRNAAIEVLAQGDGSLSDLAAGLGYSGQSCLTRAVRRWMGAPPRDVRDRLAS